MKANQKATILWLQLCFCFFCLGANIYPQSSYAPNSVPYRDPKALEIAKQALDGLGGQGVWSTVKYIHIDATVTTSQGNQRQIPTVFEDSFQSGIHRGRRQATGINGQNQVVSYGGIAVDTSDKARKREKSQVPMCEILPYLPAETLLAALSDPKYDVTLPPSTRPRPEDSVAVAISPYKAGLTRQSCHEIWYFSTSTKLPIRMDILQLSSDLLLLDSSPQASMVVTWKDFRTFGQLFLASDTEIDGPGTSRTSLAITQASSSTQIPDAELGATR